MFTMHLRSVCFTPYKRQCRRFSEPHMTAHITKNYIENNRTTLKIIKHIFIAMKTVLCLFSARHSPPKRMQF